MMYGHADVLTRCECGNYAVTYITSKLMCAKCALEELKEGLL